jgi:diaminohydroxyphosphoribosylaminopyrimidine deaminase/5-amino-6-(5-phosphoribosylamino)uracil reductase
VLKHEEHENLFYVRLNEDNFFGELVSDLHKQKIQSVIIEGGAQTLQLFIDAKLWDEARIFTSSRIFGDGITSPTFKGVLRASQYLQNDRLEVFHSL